MKQYVALTRVSTEKQKDTRLGLDSQSEAINAYVKSTSGTIIASFEEVVSGNYKEKIVGDISLQKLLSPRPEFLKAVELCKKTGATLIAKESSRISRSPLVIEFLINSGIDFIAADNPNDNALMIRIKSAVNAEELKRISERTSAALQQRKKQLSENGSFISKSGKLCLKLGTNNFNKKPRPKRESSFSELKGYIDSLRSNKLSYGEIEKKLKAEGKEISKASIYRLCAA